MIKSTTHTISTRTRRGTGTTEPPIGLAWFFFFLIFQNHLCMNDDGAEQRSEFCLCKLVCIAYAYERIGNVKS